MNAFERITRGTEEVVLEEELMHILEKDDRKAYIGFEPSGLAHIGWKICADKIRDFVYSGFKMYILLADWHAYINDKLGGDMEHIRICGEYMKDCLEAMGVKRTDVEYIYASDYVNDPSYWGKVIKIAKGTSLARIKRAMTIMGRKEGDEETDSS